jgi:hypothetical protein
MDSLKFQLFGSLLFYECKKFELYLLANSFGEKQTFNAIVSFIFLTFIDLSNFTPKNR